MGQFEVIDVIAQPLILAGTSVTPIIVIVDFTGTIGQTTSTFYRNGVQMTATDLYALAASKIGSMPVSVCARSGASGAPPDAVADFTASDGIWKVTHESTISGSGATQRRRCLNKLFYQPTNGIISNTAADIGIGYSDGPHFNPLFVLKDRTTSAYYFGSTCVCQAYFAQPDENINFMSPVTSAPLTSGIVTPVGNNVLYFVEKGLVQYVPPPTPGPTDDPYSGGGTTTSGGGDGNWSIINDPIDFPALPTISVAEAGFISIWTPELSELRRLASFMWCADPFKIEFWKQMISNPIDLILGLQLLPFDIPAEGVGRVTLGLIDSKIDMHYTDQQFHEIDCGELELAEYWGAFLDYGPFTGLEIFLPFIGVRPLNVNDCMPKTIHVKYRVDIVTGTCVALVKCDDSVFYHFNGSCAAQVPVTSGQAQQLFGQALSSAIKIATGAATGGIAGALASTVGVASAAAQSGGAAGADRSGTISGTAGFMDNMTPYLIVTRPRQAVPDNQNELTGYPSFINAQLGELEGYTEVQVSHLHHMSCTATEVEEITQLLQEGVIF